MKESSLFSVLWADVAAQHNFSQALEIDVRGAKAAGKSHKMPL